MHTLRIKTQSRTLHYERVPFKPWYHLWHLWSFEMTSKSISSFKYLLCLCKNVCIVLIHSIHYSKNATHSVRSQGTVIEYGWAKCQSRSASGLVMQFHVNWAQLRSFKLGWTLHIMAKLGVAQHSSVGIVELVGARLSCLELNGARQSSV